MDPGDLIEMEATLVRLRPPVAIFRGGATLRGERLARIEHLVLAFGQDVVGQLDEQENAADEAALKADSRSLADLMPDTAGASAQSATGTAL